LLLIAGRAGLVSFLVSASYPSSPGLLLDQGDQSFSSVAFIDQGDQPYFFEVLLDQGDQSYFSEVLLDQGDQSFSSRGTDRSGRSVLFL